jgi:hypothetical protein
MDQPPPAVAYRTAVEEPRGPDFGYVKTLPGILKIIEVVLSIITFALSMSEPWGYLGGGWVNFVAINGFIFPFIWGLLHMFGVVPQILMNYFIELIYYALWTLFYFIAGIVAAVQGSIPVVGAASFFSFSCMIVFGIDLVRQTLAVRAQYKARNDRRPASNVGGGGPEDTLFERPGGDKGFY